MQPPGVKAYWVLKSHDVYVMVYDSPANFKENRQALTFGNRPGFVMDCMAS